MSLNIINILIVVDTQGALASNSLKNNIYMVDSEKYLGSWSEGTDQLHTICSDGQQLNWRVIAISSDDNVVIEGFSGDMVNKHICNPIKQGMAGNEYWGSRVESEGSFSSYAYVINLSIDCKSMSFNPFIKVV